jgi:hypothetical protein
MKKILIATAAAAALMIANVAAPQQAEAHWRGGGVAAGVIGGLAAGALIGAAANGYGGYYGPGPYAYGPGPYAAYYGPGCYWTRHRVWTGYGWRWRRARVCG